MAVRISLLAKTLLPAAVTGLLLAIYARFFEPKRLEFTHLDLSSGNDPLTIAFVTDTHIGPNFSAGDLAPTISALESIRPDVILFGGDFISESPRFLHELADPLRRMCATATQGCWGIWGNHDLANIRSRVQPVLESCGVTMLTNESALLRDDLWLAGIDDILLGKQDVPKTFAAIPQGSRVIAMWHEPDRAEWLVPYHPIIMLSGHTHGGQVRIPGIGPLATPKLGKRYVAGKFSIDGMLLYVSRGIGMYRPPVRLFCRPELVVIRVD